ncbi:MAG: O-antigen ligase family protein, partial [Alphaproteobacteria bacterium]
AYRLGRMVLFLFTLTLPFWFDNGVAEVAGDVRWALNEHTVLALGLVLLLALWQKAPAQIHVRMPWLGWVVAGLAVTALISCIDTANPYRSWFQIKCFLGHVGLFYVAYTLYHPRMVKPLIWSIVLPLLLIGPLGMAQFLDITDAKVASALWGFWPTGWLSHNGSSFGLVDWARAYFPQAAPPGGTFANKNIGASYLVLVLPLAIYLVISTRQLAARTVAAAALALGLTMLIFGRSRASWLAFILAMVSLGVWLVLRRKEIMPLLRPHLNRSLAILAAAVLAMVATIWPMTSPYKDIYAINLSVMEQATNIQKLDDFGPRIAYNRNGLDMILDHPLNGIGIGAYHSVFPKYWNSSFPTPRVGYSVEARPQRTHNDLMQAFVEMGVINGLLHIAAVVLVMLMGWKLTAPRMLEKTGLAPVFLTVAMLGLCINALGDFPLQLPTSPALLFMLMGTLTAMALHTGAIAFAPRLQVKLPVPHVAVWAVLLLLNGALLVFIYQDNAAFRQANVYLKNAMARTMGGAIDDVTLDTINAAKQTYAWDARMQEFRGIIYAHYNGTRPMTSEMREEAIREAMQYDPYAANHMINLSALLFRRAEEQERLGNKAASFATLAEIETLIPRLMEVADFSHYTYNIAGLLYLKQGRTQEGVNALLTSMRLNPSDTMASSTLKSLGLSITTP